jgi:hypothetical protein
MSGREKRDCLRQMVETLSLCNHGFCRVITSAHRTEVENEEARPLLAEDQDGFEKLLLFCGLGGQRFETVRRK